MLDRERILSRLAALEQYLADLRKIAPESIDDYKGIEKKRACERLLQISIEAIIDTCHLLSKGLKLGIPFEETDIFDKLAEHNVISMKMKNKLVEMKGFRNILVDEYGKIDDNLVFHVLVNRLDDFEGFKARAIDVLQSHKPT